MSEGISSTGSCAGGFTLCEVGFASFHRLEVCGIIQMSDLAVPPFLPHWCQHHMLKQRRLMFFTLKVFIQDVMDAFQKKMEEVSL